MATLSLFDFNPPQPAPKFGGETYDPKRDGKRLQVQLTAVTRALSDHEPMTLDQIQAELYAQGIYASTASISARIRDLRKRQFGGHTVNRIYLGKGLYSYQMTGGAA